MKDVLYEFLSIPHYLIQVNEIDEAPTCPFDSYLFMIVSKHFSSSNQSKRHCQ